MSYYFSNYQDYEEPDPPHPNTRMRCLRGHFVSLHAPSQGWIEGGRGEFGEPLYKAALETERAEIAELYCAKCGEWFEP